MIEQIDVPITSISIDKRPNLFSDKALNKKSTDEAFETQAKTLTLALNKQKNIELKSLSFTSGANNFFIPFISHLDTSHLEKISIPTITKENIALFITNIGKGNFSRLKTLQMPQGQLTAAQVYELHKAFIGHPSIESLNLSATFDIPGTKYADFRLQNPEHIKTSS